MVYGGLMARYYFHFRKGEDFIEDEEGLEFTDSAAARTQGVDALREMLASDVQHGFLDRRCVIEIEDDRHRPVGAIDCDEVLRIIG